MHKGWIGVDLDGTLAHYDRWRGIEHIGEPIAPMVERVKAWLEAGDDVRIFTARVAPADDVTEVDMKKTRHTIAVWCKKHLGRVLPITAMKDRGLLQLWDDRAVAVVPNEGLRIG